MFGWFGRARRDAAAAARVDELRSRVRSAGDHVHLVLILQVYQQVHRGTKAFVQLEGSEWTRDAFFWWVWMEAGSMAAVTSSVGWGPHSQRDDVLWVGGRDLPAGTGIYGIAPAADVRRWNRHHSRR